MVTMFGEWQITARPTGKEHAMETQPDMNLVIAANLKALRAAKQLSLGEAAERTGVSKSMLGQIERGESSPTISTLWKIATGLQVSFTSLMEQPEPQTQLIREADMQPLTGDEGRFLLYPVIQSCAGRPFEILDLVLAPGALSASQPHADGTQEFVLVYEGVLEVRLGTAQTSCLVHQGEVLHYHADQCHTYHNPGSTPTRAAMVIQYTAQ